MFLLKTSGIKIKLWLFRPPWELNMFQNFKVCLNKRCWDIEGTTYPFFMINGWKKEKIESNHNKNSYFLKIKSYLFISARMASWSTCSMTISRRRACIALCFHVKFFTAVSFSIFKKYKYKKSIFYNTKIEWQKKMSIVICD